MASGTHVWLVLMKAHKSLHRHATRSIEVLDMCFSDFAVLELLLHKGPQPVNEIGRRIELTSGSITTAIDRLEERGLVVRSFDPRDRRARIVSLTKQGTVRIREVFSEHERAMDRAASGLSRTERDVVAKLLVKLGTSAEEKFNREREKENVTS